MANTSSASVADSSALAVDQASQYAHKHSAVASHLVRIAFSPAKTKERLPFRSRCGQLMKCLGDEADVFGLTGQWKARR